MSPKYVANVLLFQTGWFVCVLFGSMVGLVATVLILLLHFTLIVEQGKGKREARLLLILLLIGAVLEFDFLIFGILQREDGFLLPPAWLLCLWVLFATTLNHSLAWLKYKPYATTLLAFFLAPVSYFAGAKLNADIQLSDSAVKSLGFIGVCWAIFLPLVLKYLLPKPVD
ncbi:MAG: DUF2878 domain-containing protein [Cellvibrionaceae bacterium]|nr:DUF2878 domain-containing protein [Cellvibrionaceae bacterium]